MNCGAQPIEDRDWPLQETATLPVRSSSEIPSEEEVKHQALAELAEVSLLHQDQIAVRRCIPVTPARRRQLSRIESVKLVVPAATGINEQRAPDRLEIQFVQTENRQRDCRSRESAIRWKAAVLCAHRMPCDHNRAKTNYHPDRYGAVPEPADTNPKARVANAEYLRIRR